MKSPSRAIAVIATATVALMTAACGESTSTARSTAPAAPRANVDEGALAEALAATDLPEPALAAARPAERTETAAPATTEPAPAAEAAAAPSHEEVHADNGLTLRRFVVAHDVENREPVGAESPFMSTGEPVFAFMELRNESSEALEVRVTFEREDGRAVGPVTLEIPANAPRWRTWARSSWLRTPGTWTAVVRTAEGEILQSVEFEIES